MAERSAQDGSAAGLPAFFEHATETPSCGNDYEKPASEKIASSQRVQPAGNGHRDGPDADHGIGFVHQPATDAAAAACDERVQHSAVGDASSAGQLGGAAHLLRGHTG